MVVGKVDIGFVPLVLWVAEGTMGVGAEVVSPECGNVVLWVCDSGGIPEECVWYHSIQSVLPF
jgi:hypothetical protein